MSRPLIIDAFPFNNELDILEMRLTELAGAVDYFVIVEATRDHQDHPKPLHYADNAERFAAWHDKIIHVVVADGELPSMADDANPWAREHGQREFIARGLDRIVGLSGADVVMQSDVDEIPKAMHVRALAGMDLQGTIVFGQRGHFFAIDWLYPEPWYGTTATTVWTLRRMADAVRMPFAHMRDQRLVTDCPPGFEDAGWHFSWLGGPEVALAKVRSFCHPEVEERILDGLATDRFLRHGYHVDGKRMAPVEVDGSYPKWIRDGHAPAAWFRLRDEVAA